MFSFLHRVFGSRNERVLRSMQGNLDAINKFAPLLEKQSDQELKNHTAIFRQRIDNGESLESILPEAFAVVRETSHRVLNMRHFDVQMLGGMALHSGKIAEMRTGEGKTLVATLAAYLNALPGNGAHVVTVNDYLARRDAEWMGKIYNFLDMSVGVIIPDLGQDDRRAAYKCDISYCTSNELGFDFLRDNIAGRPQDQVQQKLNFAIVDEVDCILIDEARTPLIISGPADDDIDMYRIVTSVVAKLKPEHYETDEKSKQAYLTEAGHEEVERLLVSSGSMTEGASLYDSSNLQLMHYVTTCLRARLLFKKDVDYMVNSQGKVLIIDSFTGRAMAGRRWSDGLHQAIEALENLEIQRENQTHATVTFQNFFRIYNKLAGMTGTADTEATEFQQIYNLEVVVIPTHQEMVREDFSDVVFLTMTEKYDAIIEDIEDCVTKQQPVLVGTTSIESSEHISSMLRQKNVSHEVLNAKYHEREAAIIAQAGKPGAVTIATNMAGRGTDIVLGGNPKAELSQGTTEEVQQKLQLQWQQQYQQVLTSGGLHIIGTERHESRRIDNQLRGRSGRQGDPGSSRFYLSMEDNLMRIFAAERISGIMKKLGMQKGEVIEHPWVSKSIENAQRKVESHNFELRKQLLEYDNVANEQRTIIYAQRKDIMAMEDVSGIADAMCTDTINYVCDQHIPPDSLPELWNLPELQKQLRQQLDMDIDMHNWLQDNEIADADILKNHVIRIFEEQRQQRIANIPTQLFHSIQKHILLDVIDRRWREHLQSIDHLRNSIGLRAYAMKNPKQEFKREALELFSSMLDRIGHDVSTIISHLQINQSNTPPVQPSTPALEHMQGIHRAGPNLLQPPPEQAARKAIPVASDNQRKASEIQSGLPESPVSTPGVPQQTPYTRPGQKIGRNKPCHCGSGKKYKNCHGKIS